jgi:hypothetical protein
MGKREIFMKGSPVVILLFFAGCLFGSCTYSKPTAYEMETAVGRINVSSQEDAIAELRVLLKRASYAGDGLFVECEISGAGPDGICLECEKYEYKEVRHSLRNVDGSWSYYLKREVTDRYHKSVPLCPTQFKAVRQIPTMGYCFFVNGFSFGGSKEKALRAYGLLSYICGQ